MKCSARMIGVIYEVLSANVKRPAGLHSANVKRPAGLHSANVKRPAGLLLSDPRVAADLVTTIGAVCKSVFTLPSSQLDEHLPAHSQFYSDHRVNCSTFRYLWTAHFLHLSFAFTTKYHRKNNNAVKTHRTA